MKVLILVIGYLSLLYFCKKKLKKKYHMHELMELKIGKETIYQEVELSCEIKRLYGEYYPSAITFNEKIYSEEAKAEIKAYIKKHERRIENDLIYKFYEQEQ